MKKIAKKVAVFICLAILAVIGVLGMEVMNQATCNYLSKGEVVSFQVCMMTMSPSGLSQSLHLSNNGK